MSALAFAALLDVFSESAKLAVNLSARSIPVKVLGTPFSSGADRVHNLAEGGDRADIETKPGRDKVVVHIARASE